MRQETERKLLGTARPDEFIGRDDELARITAHGLTRAGGLLVMAAPGAGASETLRQVYDRLFTTQQDVVPFYFAFRPTDRCPRETARRFLQDLITQTVAFRRRDAGILDSSPEMQELARLAIPEDGYWIDRLIESCRSEAECDDDLSFVRSVLGAPFRAAAGGVHHLVMIDNIHHAANISGSLFGEIQAMYHCSGATYVLSGARRFLYGTPADATLSIDALDAASAGELAEVLAAGCGSALNGQTRDLIALQLGGRPWMIRALIATAAAHGEPLDSFASVERAYADCLFSRIGRTIDPSIRECVPAAAERDVLRLIGECMNSGTGHVAVEYWRKSLDLDDDTFDRMLRTLHVNEIVSVDSGNVRAETEDIVLCDHLLGRRRLELIGDSRALVVGESTAEFIKRAPKLLSRLYRQISAIGLRAALDAFGGQEIPAAAIDHTAFKRDLKGLSDDEIDRALSRSDDTVTLPRIVYTANTSAFYPKIGEIIEDERSAVAIGFEDAGYRDDLVWIAAEIDSKLEAAADVAEFWCDRLEMVAVSCGFENFRVWLVAPEGFDDDAMDLLRSRGSIGSSRKQFAILLKLLTGTEIGPSDDSGVYEIVIPMGDDTEMIAASAVEEIARRHNIPARTINQIKTALVEACINATEHSHSPDRRIHVKFAFDGLRLTVIVSNRGIRLTDRPLKEFEPDEGRRGWGLKLMRALMDDVRIEQTDDGARVTMVKHLAEGDGD